MINKFAYLLVTCLLTFTSIAKGEKAISFPNEATAWTVYASLSTPSAEFFYSDHLIKKIGDIYEVEVLKNYNQLQYVGQGYGKEYNYMSSIEVQQIDCKTDLYQSKLVTAFKKTNAKEPAFYSEQTKGDWHSSEGNGGQRHLHKIVCAKDAT